MLKSAPSQRRGVRLAGSEALRVVSRLSRTASISAPAGKMKGMEEVMGESYVPDGYSRVVPYLTVEDANRLLDFLTQVFEAEVVDKNDRSDGKLAHAAVRIGDSIIELAEASDRFGAMPGAIHIYGPDVDRTHGLALKHGGETVHEPMEMDYGERASAIKDPMGNHWYIATYRRS